MNILQAPFDRNLEFSSFLNLRPNSVSTHPPIQTILGGKQILKYFLSTWGKENMLDKRDLKGCRRDLCYFCIKKIKFMWLSKFESQILRNKRVTD